MTNEQMVLVMGSDAIVYAAIHRYYKRVPLDFEDLVSIGRLGLISAALTFNSEKGDWCNHATFRVRSEIKHYIERQLQKKRRAPDGCLSIDGPIPGTDGLYLDDLLASNEPDPLDAVCDQERNADIHSALSNLDPFAYECVRRYYWIGLSQACIADQLGVTPIRVSRTIRRSLIRMKTVLEELECRY